MAPGLTYIGLDINPSTKSKFESADWLHIEIGDSGNPAFWATIKAKYPHVDIFLDDGGHTMAQQKTAIRQMLPHVQPQGVYMCEDLSTSWHGSFGGVPNGWVTNQQFLEPTTAGFVHKTLDWLNYGWIKGGATRYLDLPDNFFGEEDKDFWRTIPQQVKHIHYYNQAVVYEKGQTYAAGRYNTVGTSIPLKDSGVHAPLNWTEIVQRSESLLEA